MSFKYNTVSGIKIIDLDAAVCTEIEPLVQEDDHKFCLQSKDQLLRKFIVYRVCNFVLRTIELNRSERCNILFYMRKEPLLEFLQNYNLFICNTFIKLSKILSLSLHVNTLSIQDFTKILHNEKGEGREMRARVNFIFNRNLKKPDLQKFNKLLSKYSIHKIEGDMDTGFKVKLGLFVT